MRMKESFKAFSNWCNNHYGFLALVLAIISFGLAFYQNLIGYNQQVILNYKMEKVEAELIEYKNKENQRIEFDAFIGNEIKEMKGYVRGKQDGLLQFVLNLPEDYNEYLELKRKKIKKEKEQ